MHFIKNLFFNRFTAYAVSFLISASIYSYFVLNAAQWHASYLVRKDGSQVVKLVNPENHENGGTGFAVRTWSGRIYTLTNGHVCGLAKGGIMHGIVPGDSRHYNLRVLEEAETTDLCLLEAMPGYTGIKLASGYALGEGAAVVGHPLLTPLTFNRGRLTAYETIKLIFKQNVPAEACSGVGYEWKDLSGTVAELFGIHNVCYREVKSIYTNIQIYPGNSGSPVVNFYGNLVGVMFAGNGANYGYMVPLEDVAGFLSIY